MRQLELPRSAPIADLALSPDGKTLAVAHRSYGIGLYDPFDGTIRAEIRGHFSQLQFRTDGRWLVATKPTGAVIDIGTTVPQYDYLRANEYVLAGEFPDDASVAFLTSTTYRQLTLPTATGSYGQDYRPFVVAEQNVNGSPSTFTFQPIGIGPRRELLGVEYGSKLTHRIALILDQFAKRLLAVLDDPDFQISTDTTYRRQGDWFAVASNRELSIYNWADIDTLSTPVREPRRRGLFEALRETLVGPSRQARHDDRYGALPTLRPRHRLPAVGQPPVDALPVAFLPDGSAFLCRGPRSAIELRDLATGEVRATWQFKRAWPRALAVAPDGLTALAAVKGGTVVLWDLE